MSETETNEQADITVSPFYHSAVNEVTKPNSLVFTSHYFADRWMRDLGPVGTSIVIALRSHCYQNRATGELRNRIQVPVPQIAAEIGVSAKTVRREIERNKTLQKFIQRREEYAPGPTPQSLRTDAYSYLVAMDDPVHPLDEELLQKAIQAKVQRMEKGGAEEDAKTRARQKQRSEKQEFEKQKPHGQIDHAEDDRVVNLSIPPGQNDHARVNLSIPPGQNDQTLIDSSESLEFKKNPSSDFSTSSFPDQEQIREDQKSDPRPLPFVSLSAAEQSRWLEQAEQELRQSFGLEAWLKTGDKARAGIRRQRAASLYDASNKSPSMTVSSP